jgi:hypothetical protein
MCAAIRPDPVAFVNSSNELDGSWRSFHRNTLSFVPWPNKLVFELTRLMPVRFAAESIAPAEGQGIRFEIRS